MSDDVKQETSETMLLAAADELAECLSRVFAIEYSKSVIESDGDEGDADEAYQESRKIIMDDVWERIERGLRR